MLYSSVPPEILTMFCYSFPQHIKTSFVSRRISRRAEVSVNGRAHVDTDMHWPLAVLDYAHVPRHPVTLECDWFTHA